MTKDFATDPVIGAELDRQARRLREERRIRAESRAYRQPAPAIAARPLSQLLPRSRR